MRLRCSAVSYPALNEEGIMQLFKMRFTVLGDVADYDREVIVLADNERDAANKITNHNIRAVNVQCVEVLPKFTAYIFGVSVIPNANL